MEKELKAIKKENNAQIAAVVAQDTAMVLLSPVIVPVAAVRMAALRYKKYNQQKTPNVERARKEAIKAADWTAKCLVAPFYMAYRVYKQGATKDALKSADIRLQNYESLKKKEYEKLKKESQQRAEQAAAVRKQHEAERAAKEDFCTRLYDTGMTDVIDCLKIAPNMELSQITYTAASNPVALTNNLIEKANGFSNADRDLFTFGDGIKCVLRANDVVIVQGEQILCTVPKEKDIRNAVFFAAAERAVMVAKWREQVKAQAVKDTFHQLVLKYEKGSR